MLPADVLTAACCLPLATATQACAGYSSAIAYGRRIGSGKDPRREPYRHGTIPAHLVAAEWQRSSRVPCAECGKPGATLFCRCSYECKLGWHLPCAREVAQRSGSSSIVFSEGVMELACARHADT